MSDNDLTNLDNIEIEPLSDEDLDTVAGGTVCPSNSCSTSGCSNQPALLDEA